MEAQAFDPEPVVFFSPNGAPILLTGTYVRPWAISVAAWVKHLCSILPRTLTADEVKQYLGGWSLRELKLCGRK